MRLRGWIDEVDGISGFEPLGKNMMVTLSGFGAGDAVGEAVGDAVGDAVGRGHPEG
jgi:hypothetical protein